MFLIDSTGAKNMAYAVLVLFLSLAPCQAELADEFSIHEIKPYMPIKCIPHFHRNIQIKSVCYGKEISFTAENGETVIANSIGGEVVFVRGLSLLKGEHVLLRVGQFRSEIELVLGIPDSRQSLLDCFDEGPITLWCHYDSDNKLQEIWLTKTPDSRKIYSEENSATDL